MEKLVEKAQKGDEEAFTELVINIEKDLYKIARMRLDCEDDINEVVQETIIQTFKSIKKLKEPKYFKTWIIRILINKCNKQYKKIKRDKEIEYNEDILNNCKEEINSNNLDFFILIKNLNYDERMSLTLYYLEDFTTKEISKILKQPESTIRNRISRSKAKLKKYVKEVDYNG